MRISRDPTDPNQTLGRFRQGKLMVTINRCDYWQCAYIIRKGAFEEIRSHGIEAFRHDIAHVVPEFSHRVNEIKDWNEVKLLTVLVDHLREWSRPGLLCIGDAAHAMSPMGGVGINLAIQDAVASANILAEPLSYGIPHERELREVQSRREFPTAVVQRMQVFAHKRIVNPSLSALAPLRRLPLPLRLMQHFPVIQRFLARAVGVGPRPEHVLTPDVHSS
jgi:2-polyprenyl-6-methoxyphenol hydroxylase-like FAD-dependent oxidoreductase